MTHRVSGVPVKLLLKLLLFVISFSLVFYLLRTHPGYRAFLAADLKDLGGIPWLYSIVGMIFSMLAAFIVQREWEHWSNLLGAMKEEVSALDQLWHWSHHFPGEIQQRLQEAIWCYLSCTIAEGWGGDGQGADNEAVEDVLASLRDATFAMARQPELMLAVSSMVAEITKHRWDRLNAGARRMPRILKYTLIFADGLVIVLSLFIGVRNVWLDYLFTTSIALLVYLVYLVVEDLEHPLRPGIWHVTSIDYQRLRQRLQRANKAARPDQNLL
ncbi:MAG: hypothetical protein KGO52_14330 [Nitrospirota bacterium]|nr:hypothetical protein [Nitrospirota bacterium]MDE3224270.1 hypothetical protein [Nitrospirota bacterium]MDE3243889.1 hypothetical protein [Nitrospirota bacterium]